MIPSPPRAPRDTPLLVPGATLARLLATIDGAPVAPSKASFAERLGGWFEWRDAIALSEVLNAAAAGAVDADDDADTVAAPVDVDQIARDAQRLRTRLDALTRDPVAPVARPGRALHRATLTTSPTKITDTAIEAEPDLAALRQRYQSAQREMTTDIAELRLRLRDALTAASPALGRLAALDAVMERVVGEREQLLLDSVPQRLGGHDLRRRLQTLLGAELALRWQPIEALLAALKSS